MFSDRLRHHLNSSVSRHRRHDYRTRSDRVQIRLNSWREQMDYLVDAYLHWAAGGPPKEHAVDAEEWTFTTVSLEGMS